MIGTIASFAIHAVEQVPPEPGSALCLGSVLISGLDRLTPAGAEEISFVERWRAAMIFQLGAEEFEKFCLSRRRLSPL